MLGNYTFTIHICSIMAFIRLIQIYMMNLGVFELETNQKQVWFHPIKCFGINIINILVV